MQPSKIANNSFQHAGLCQACPACIFDETKQRNEVHRAGQDLLLSGTITERVIGGDTSVAVSAHL